MPSPQARYWICTIPYNDWIPHLPAGVQWCKGQREIGQETGFDHWQVVCSFDRKLTRHRAKQSFTRTTFLESTRSSAAEEYVWKEETRVPDSQFEFGTKLLSRNRSNDWECIWEMAKSGQLESIPADIRIRYYNSLCRISARYASPIAMERVVSVFWGRTGSGKSRRAWDEAGEQAYYKDPRSKFWCGYNGQETVIIDEFRGGIDISHVLRWTDRYPVTVEVKGGSVPLCAKRFYFTSNINPRVWYPDLDEATLAALLRRMDITEFL